MADSIITGSRRHSAGPYIHVTIDKRTAVHYGTGGSQPGYCLQAFDAALAGSEWGPGYPGTQGLWCLDVKWAFLQADLADPLYM